MVFRRSPSERCNFSVTISKYARQCNMSHNNNIRTAQNFIFELEINQISL